MSYQTFISFFPTIIYSVRGTAATVDMNAIIYINGAQVFNATNKMVSNGSSWTISAGALIPAGAVNVPIRIVISAGANAYNYTLNPSPIFAFKANATQFYS